MRDRSARDRQFHELTAHHYHGTVVEPRGLGNDALFASAERFLPRRGPALQTLDLGAGTGHMALRLRARSASITLVDHSPSMLAIAREHLLQQPGSSSASEFHESDVLAWTRSAVQAGRRFDVVTSVGLLHHLDAEAIPALARDVSQLLTRRGVWIVAEPVVTAAAEPDLLRRWNALYRSRFVLPWSGIEEPDEGPLDPGTLAQAMATAGLKPRFERRGWEIFPRLGALDRLVIPLLDRLDRTHGPVHLGVYGPPSAPSPDRGRIGD